MAVARLARALLTRHPADAARILEKHPPEMVATLLRKHADEIVANVIAACLPLCAAAFLDYMADEEAARIVETLNVAHALPVLRHIPPGRRDRVLDSLPAATGTAFRRLLSYPRDSAGANMNPFALILREDMTIADAMHRVRNVGREIFYFPYIVDRDQRLVGILTVRDLMLAGPKQPLSEVMRRDLVRVPAAATFKEIDRIPGCRAYQSLPVVDAKGALVGVLSQDAFRAMEIHTSGDARGRPLTEGLVAVGEVFVRSQATLIPLMADAVSAVLGSPKKEGERHAG